MPATLTLDDVTVTRGAVPVLDAVDLIVAPGDRIGLVGPNGVGKSTLLAAAAGAIAIDRGAARTSPPNASIGWLRQEPERSGEQVLDLLRRRTGISAAETELDAATVDLAAGAEGAADRYDLALQRWLGLGAADFDARVGEVAAELGMAAPLLARSTADLSGGESARVGLAALLLSRFDVYLLDEPTNDLDLDGLARLEAWVLSTAGAPMLIVSHDRQFLERAVTDVVEIDEFTHRAARFGGGWQAYVDERERARRHAWEAFDQYDSQRRDLSARAQRQREWAQQGQAKVRKSGENDKHIRSFRVDQSEQLAGKSAQTKRAIDRLNVVDKPRESWELRLEIPDAPRSGNVVVRLSGVTVERAGFRLGPIDELVEYGERISIAGPNGSGKSTLVDVILGRLEPTAGTAQLGSSVVVGEIEQVRQQLTGTDTLLRAFTDATGLDVPAARTLLAKFGLVGAHVGRATDTLSPGERTRAALALLMANGANLLVLDEPTNHLDLPAIEQLEQALATFAGTLLVVSHDRRFLENVAVDRTIRLG